MRRPIARRRRRPGSLALSTSLSASLAAMMAAGVAPSSALAQGGTPDLGTEEQRAAGELLYGTYCSQCHGDDGAGRGIAEPFLRPAPRDFTSGKYKIRSTPTGYVPTDEDLRRAIRDGLPGTGMPGFQEVLSERQITNLVYYLKSLAPDFEDPNAYAEPVPVPDPPPFSDDSLDVGYQTYVEIGCARCHGEQGRGDGRSAPTMRDDWGDFVPPADLTMPWRFRGGGSREDIFRSISTGLYGTPMAGFADGLTEEQRWQIVDWIVAQARELGATGDPGEAPYDSLVRAVPAAGTLDAITEDGDLEAARELFEGAPRALFPVVGQVIQPGRSFQPGTAAVGVQAIYDSLDVAFLVTWHNITAEASGHNGPDLQVERQDGVAFPGLREDGEAEADEAGAEADGDVWGTGGGQTADPFGQATTAAPGPPPGSDEFSDAIALQLPVELREGAEKPYFLWGDTSYPVELWFVDLANPEATVFEGRGLGAVTPTDARPPEVLAGYEDGEWAVVFKRPRNPTRGVAFDEETFVPIAFSVWDGFYRERGPRRGVSRWFHVYLEPEDQPSVLAPMAKAGLTVLALELLVVGWVRRRHRLKQGSSDPTAAGGGE